MKKKLSQFTDPAIMYAAGREVCVKSSVVKMLVTPPFKEGTNQAATKETAVSLVMADMQQRLLRRDFNGG